MAKKYLDLEEAALQLGTSVGEVKRLRESGELRGFADRGTWKFKAEDISELARMRQADSDPDVPLLDDEIESGSSVVLGDAEGSSVMIAGDSDVVGEQPTVIRQSALEDESGILGGTSDSDVRLIPDGGIPAEAASDSDVQLIGDSSQSAPDSDSDVQLITPDGDSSALVGLGGTEVDSPMVSMDDDSGISLAPDADSGITLEPDADSGISLEPDADSGITLADEDSGIALEPEVDSGISLADAQDSGIALEGDSGIRLADPADSGISLDFGDADDGDSVTATIPVMATPPIDDLGKTELEVPTLDDDGSEFDLAAEADDSGDGADTSVILFDDEEDVDEYSATAVGGGTPGEQDVFNMEEDFGDDDLEVAEDVDGEDDELDVFDAVDEDFEDTFDTGESHAEFVAPIAGAGQVATAAEADWGVGTFLGLLFSTALMLVLGVLVFDLVRSMWTWNEPTGISTTLISTFRDLF